MIVKNQPLPARCGARLRASLIVLVGLVLASGVYAEVANAAGRAIDLAAIVISFKLDPQLTRSLYMGDRWVSRTKYSTTVQTGGQVIFEARAVGKTKGGRPTVINPAWQIVDCNIVEVSPARGNAVTIVATKTGRCELVVSAGEISHVMTIDVVSKNEGMQVTVTQ